MTAPKPVITGVRTVSVPVDDQERALGFYVDTLGFTVLRDEPIPTGRSIELTPGGDNVVVTLEQATADVTRGPVMIRFTTDDAVAAHAALNSAGVDTAAGDLGAQPHGRECGLDRVRGTGVLGGAFGGGDH
jgi:catechol 2,3-dioxygenase-like lactoylglutathione lyase family enzyme